MLSEEEANVPIVIVQINKNNLSEPIATQIIDIEDEFLSIDSDENQPNTIKNQRRRGTKKITFVLNEDLLKQKNIKKQFLVPQSVPQNEQNFVGGQYQSSNMVTSIQEVTKVETKVIQFEENSRNVNPQVSRNTNLANEEQKLTLDIKENQINEDDNSDHFTDNSIFRRSKSHQGILQIVNAMQVLATVSVSKSFASIDLDNLDSHKITKNLYNIDLPNLKDEVQVHFTKSSKRGVQGTFEMSMVELNMPNLYNIILKKIIRIKLFQTEKDNRIKVVFTNARQEEVLFFKFAELFQLTKTYDFMSHIIIKRLLLNGQSIHQTEPLDELSNQIFQGEILKQSSILKHWDTIYAVYSNKQITLYRSKNQRKVIGKIQNIKELWTNFQLLNHSHVIFRIICQRQKINIAIPLINFTKKKSEKNWLAVLLQTINKIPLQEQYRNSEIDIQMEGIDQEGSSKYWGIRKTIIYQDLLFSRLKKQSKKQLQVPIVEGFVESVQTIDKKSEENISQEIKSELSLINLKSEQQTNKIQTISEQIKQQALGQEKKLRQTYLNDRQFCQEDEISIIQEQSVSHSLNGTQFTHQQIANNLIRDSKEQFNISQNQDLMNTIQQKKLQGLTQIKTGEKRPTQIRFFQTKTIKQPHKKGIYHLQLPQLAGTISICDKNNFFLKDSIFQMNYVTLYLPNIASIDIRSIRKLKIEKNQNGQLCLNITYVDMLNKSKQQLNKYLLFRSIDNRTDTFALFASLIVKHILLLGSQIEDQEAPILIAKRFKTYKVSGTIIKKSQYLQIWEQRQTIINETLSSFKDKYHSKCTFKIEEAKNLQTRFQMVKGHLVVRIGHTGERTEIGIPLQNYTTEIPKGNWLYALYRILN